MKNKERMKRLLEYIEAIPKAKERARKRRAFFDVCRLQGISAPEIRLTFRLVQRAGRQPAYYINDF